MILNDYEFSEKHVQLMNILNIEKIKMVIVTND